MKNYEKKFFDIVNFIKSKHPELRIRIYNKYSVPNENCRGTFHNNIICVATNVKSRTTNKIDWSGNCKVLLHEYAHFLRYQTYDKKRLKRQLYYFDYDKNGITKEERWKRLRGAAAEEYYTELLTIKLLKKFDLKEKIKGYMEEANTYLLSIKFSLEMNHFAGSAFPLKKISNKKFSRKKILAPLTEREKDLLWNHYINGKIDEDKKWKDKQCGN